MDETIEFTPTVNYAFANDDATTFTPDNTVEYNPYPNYQADVINSSVNNSDLGDNSASGIVDLLNSDVGGSSSETSMLDSIKKAFGGAQEESAKTGKPLDQVLKEYGLGDKAISSLIQLGGGMLAGASSAKMAEKNRNETWAREDAAIAKERARRDANSKAGTVSKLNYKPTGLLDAMKK